MKHTAPVNRLPQEVLSRIMKTDTIHCALQYRAPAMNYSQVSHFWRETALDTPILWSTVAIDHATVDKFGPHLKDRLEIILARSRNRQLTISFNFMNLNFENFPHLEEILSILRDTSPRWKTLHLAKTNVTYPSPPSTATSEVFDLVHLQSLTLTRVCYHDVLNLLRRAPNIVNLSVERERPLKCEPPRERFDIFIGRQDIVRLPELRSLILDESDVLPKIIAPRLETLEVLAHREVLHEVAQAVERSSCKLKSITISEIQLLDVTVERFLTAVGGDVTQLALSGLLTDHLFDVIARPSHYFLPTLESLTIKRSFEQPQGSHTYREVFANGRELAHNFSPPLEPLLAAVRARTDPDGDPVIHRLRHIEVEIPEDSFDKLEASLSAVQGLTTLITPDHTDWINERAFGAYLQHLSSQYREDHNISYNENVACVADLFTIVKGYIDGVDQPLFPNIRAAMFSFAYRRQPSAREQEYDIRERAKTIYKELDVLHNSHPA